MPKTSQFKDPELCSRLLQGIEKTLDGRTMRFMEVCGTHTCAIFQSGLRSMLPKNIKHISGPGCPVCVTHEAEVALFLKLAQEKNVIIATFGDLLRVPGPDGKSLKTAQAEGAKIAMVYSPLDAVHLAKENLGTEVVFLGIGFETTAPTVAASILAAQREKLKNYSVLSFHKLVPPVLRAILSDEKSSIDAFLLPGHVATITGLEPFSFLSREFSKPGVVGGFEALDILLALQTMAALFRNNSPCIKNTYPRAVDDKGNARARALMDQVFESTTGKWRGLGEIPDSGLSIRNAFQEFDALHKFQLKLPQIGESACKCGEVLQGQIEPPQCPLFGKRCTPANPVGPCMVSTEGSCSAYYKYGE